MNLKKVKSILFVVAICCLTISCYESQDPPETPCQDASLPGDTGNLSFGNRTTLKSGEKYDFIGSVGIWTVISGGGKIDNNGLYTAPIVTEDTKVKISVTTSKGIQRDDCPSSTASLEFMVKP